MSELRDRAVLEVLDGAVTITVARRYGVSRQTCMAGCVGMPVFTENQLDGFGALYFELDPNSRK